MKNVLKVFSILVLASIISIPQLSADEVEFYNSNSRRSGSYYSSILQNYDGVSRIEVKNNTTSNRTYKMQIRNTSKNYFEYNAYNTVSGGRTATSGQVLTRWGSYMQGRVIDPVGSYSVTFYA